MIAVLGSAATLVGAILLYLASPNQRATTRKLPGRPIALLGLIALVGGLLLLLAWAGPATAVFIWLTLAMLVWSMVPAVAAWLQHRKAAHAR